MEAFPDADFDNNQGGLEAFPDADFDNNQGGLEAFPEADFERSLPTLDELNIDDSNPTKDELTSASQFVYIIRHGEREDDVNPNWKSDRPWDPPLTERGKRQALEAGEFLAGKNIKIVYTSPFSRCLQTTKYVLKGINSKICSNTKTNTNETENETENENENGKGNSRHIRVEHGLAEFHNQKWFQEKPEFHHNAHCLPEKDAKYQSLLEPKFPETTNDMQYRYSKIGRLLAEKHPEGNLLLVTHGFAIDPMTRELIKDDDLMVLEAPYCCITTLRKLPNNSFKLVSLTSTSHLKKS